MNERTIFNMNWQWHSADSCPFPFSGQATGDLQLCRIKENPLRSVYRADRDGKPCFFLKHDHPRRRMQKIKALLKNKTRLEFESYQLLRQHQIPTIEYLGWGRAGVDGLLISQAINDAVSGKEYWFRLACEDPKLKDRFTQQLARFVRLFVATNIYHPDFHIGNILVKPATGEIILVDPYGIRSTTSLSAAQRLQMYKIFIDFRGELSPAHAIPLLITAGLAESPEEARKAWQQAITAEEKEIADGWSRRTRQILSGHSKFCTTFIRDGQRFHWRHTLWYECPVHDNNFTIDPNWKQEHMPSHEAEKIWLESFRQQLLRHPDASLPLLWQQQNNDELNTIYYQ